MKILKSTRITSAYDDNSYAKEYVKEGLFSKESYDYLYDGRTLRNKSSYDYSIVFTEELAKELIVQAEKFINEVEMLL